MFHEKYEEILELALRINRETEYAAFFDFSGHVDHMSVWLGKEKEECFNDWLYRETFYSEHDSENRLDDIINELKGFLEESR